MIKKIIIGIGIICLIVLSLFVYHNCFESKVGYIDVPKVFNGFEMKKELQGKYKKIEIARKRVIDSLSFELQLLSKKLNADKNNKELLFEFDLKREEFFKRKQQIEQDNVALSNQYDKQILEQMSQYILDYGKANNYEFIWGADGTGVVMYANEKKNISEEITVFVNAKYKGVE